MINKTFTVEKANRFIAENKHLVNTQYKPEEHFSAEIGWINDPNGFVYFCWRIPSLLSILSI